MNRSCISRIYATHNSDDSVHVVYISTHTNHSLAIEDEAKNIPLPKSIQVEISAKLQQGISVERIMEGKDLVDDNSNRETECKQAYKHYKIEQNNFNNIYNTGSDMCATISAMHECVWGGRIGLTATVIGEDTLAIIEYNKTFYCLSNTPSLLNFHDTIHGILIEKKKNR